jgi:hypothetical protein
VAEDDNFFSRWSRRKVQKQTGEPLPETPVSLASAPTLARSGVPSGISSGSVLPDATVAKAGTETPPDGLPLQPPEGQSRPQEKAPPPTLADVAELTKESDFSRFVGSDVSPDVRNAAMKKLFSDPHFNVMDGLDIYIDDYSIPSPMSKEFARTLVSAKFMKLFDEPEQTPQTQPAAAGATDTDTAKDTVWPRRPQTPEPPERPPKKPPKKSPKKPPKKPLRLPPSPSPTAPGRPSGPLSTPTLTPTPTPSPSAP